MAHQCSVGSDLSFDFEYNPFLNCDIAQGTAETNMHDIAEVITGALNAVEGGESSNTAWRADTLPTTQWTANTLPDGNASLWAENPEPTANNVWAGITALPTENAAWMNYNPAPAPEIPTAATIEMRNLTLPAENTVSTSDDAGHYNHQICAVCEERATGRHYGAVSCDGCKGFFRRSIRKMNVYLCRFSKSCRITRTNRNRCRHCRLQKCFSAGMKTSAVQNERDQISYAPACKDLPPRARYSIQNLLRIELSSRISRPQNPGPVASVAQIFESIKLQLLDLVEWAKLLPMFAELPPGDQVILLRENAGGHLLLNLAHRSMNLGDILLLRNNFVVTRFYEADTLDAALPSNETKSSLGVAAKRLSADVFEKLLKPLEDLNIDDTEIACLKAILFFHPGAPGLSSISRVRALQNEIQTNLEDYLYNRKFDGRGRFGALLLLLPVLKSLSLMMIEQIKNLQVYGIPIDDLLLEMLVRS